MGRAKRIITYIIALFILGSYAYADNVEPIRGAYGNVFPTLSNQSLEVYRSLDIAGPWYVTFKLLDNADVKVGARSIITNTSAGCCFNISSIRLTTLEGDNVAYGTDVIADNPFPNSITHLVVANNLASGWYAIEVSGSGNRSQGTISGPQDASDFITHLQVTSGTVSNTFNWVDRVLYLPYVITQPDNIRYINLEVWLGEDGTYQILAAETEEQNTAE